MAGLTYRQACSVWCSHCRAAPLEPCRGKLWGEVCDERRRLAGLRYAPQQGLRLGDARPQGSLFEEG